MKRFLLPFRLFALLFESAGPPPLWRIGQGIAALATWVALAVLTPEQPSMVMFSMAVVAFMVMGHASTPSRLRRSRELGKETSAVLVFVVASAIYGVLLLAPDPVWIQRLFTLWPILFAVACLIDIFDGKGTFAEAFWPHPSLAEARPLLARVFLLKHLAFALMNETLIATVSPEAWLIYLAILPILHHFVTSALITTVLIDLTDNN